MSTAPPTKNKMRDFLFKQENLSRIVKWSDLINFFFLQKRGVFSTGRIELRFLIPLLKTNVIKITKILWKLIVFCKVILRGLEIDSWKSKFNPPCKRRLSFKKKNLLDHSTRLEGFYCKVCFWEKNSSRAGLLSLIGTRSIFYCAKKLTTSSGPRIVTVIMYTFLYQVLTKRTIRTIRTIRS